jgi:polysaccharide biosynthesis protein PslG
MAMQGYGLWSGPTDQRMQPRVVNFSRPRYVRDIMVKNGDANKPIWISEMNWNAVPDWVSDKSFGQVSEGEQARYVTLAYERLQREWPWLGVSNVWFFKRATDQEKDQPWYYFRVVEPDFTPLPLYGAIAQASRREIVLFRGYHQEDHWGLQYAGDWREATDDRAVVQKYRYSDQVGASVTFSFEGRRLRLVAPRGPTWGRMRVQVDQEAPQEINLTSPDDRFGEVVWQRSWLSQGPHRVVLTVDSGRGALDGLMVMPAPAWFPTAPLAFAGVLAAGVAAAILLRRTHRSRRERT